MGGNALAGNVLGGAGGGGGGGGGNPAGTILAYGAASAPAGYLICDGTAVSRADYADLFAIIGTNYGNGDGSTTFNTPDLRGEFLRGHDDGAGLDPDRAARTANNPGGAVGDNVGSEQDDIFGSHSHSFLVSNYGGGTPYAATGWQGTWWRGTSGAGGNETRPVNVYVSFIIKT